MDLATLKLDHAKITLSHWLHLSCVVLVICTNGSAMSTTNEGKTWRQVTQVPGTLASRVGRRPLLAGGNYHRLRRHRSPLSACTRRTRPPVRPYDNNAIHDRCTPTVITVLGTA